MPFTTDWTKDDNLTCPECGMTGYCETREFHEELSEFDSGVEDRTKARCDCCTAEWWISTPIPPPAVPDPE